MLISTSDPSVTTIDMANKTMIVFGDVIFIIKSEYGTNNVKHTRVSLPQMCVEAR